MEEGQVTPIAFAPEAISSAVAALEIQPTESLEQQMEVLARSLAIYEDRTVTRGETWADEEFGVDDSVHHIRSKVARCEHAIKRIERRLVDNPDADVDVIVDAMLDDLQDIINYAAFGIRHLTGRKPRAGE
jgi:hypothetical protein